MSTDPAPSLGTPPRPAVLPAPLPPPALDTSALPDDPAVLKQMIAELLRALRGERRDKEAALQRLDALLRHRQRLQAANPHQPLLFAEPGADEVPPPPPPPPEEAKPSRRGKCKPHGRRRPAADLRHEPRRYELTAAERLCPQCGAQRQEFGIEITKQYDYKPAEVFVIEHQRVKYACPCCQGQVTVAAKPPQPIERGLPGPGLLAQVIVDKYQDHLPLYRTEQRFARLGVTLPRSTLGDWMAAAALRLTPLYQLLAAWVLQSKVLHTDDSAPRKGWRVQWETVPPGQEPEPCSSDGRQEGNQMT